MIFSPLENYGAPGRLLARMATRYFKLAAPLWKRCREHLRKRRGVHRMSKAVACFERRFRSPYGKYCRPAFGIFQ